MITTRTRRTWQTFLCGGAIMVLMAASNTSYALDSASIEYGSGNQTRMVRAAMQWKWNKKWWQSSGSHIGGYWDLALARWHEERFQDVSGQSQNLTAMGITPVFRLQRDTLTGPYAEVGIGIHYLSALYDNNGRQLSTRFEFGDRIGAGYVFGNNLDIGLLFEHFSNGGIKKPNAGVNFAVVRVRYRF